MSDWRHEAACRGASPEAAEGFFAFDDEAELLEAAKRVCDSCPVIEQCRAWALESGQNFGVWGGMAAEERRALRRHQGKTKSTRQHKGTRRAA